MLSRCFLDCYVGAGVFVTGLSQISSFFSSNCRLYTSNCRLFILIFLFEIVGLSHFSFLQLNDWSIRIRIFNGITHLVFHGDLIYKIRRAHGMSSRRLEKKKNSFDADSINQRSARGRSYEWSFINPYKYRSWSTAPWLIRRWGLYDGSCSNLQRSDLIVSLLQPLDLSPHTARSTWYPIGYHYIFWCNVFLSKDVGVLHLYDLSGLVGGWSFVSIRVIIYKNKKEEIWPSPMTKASTPTEMSKGQVTTQATSQKSSIKQRLRTDLGRSVGVAKATQLVWLSGLRAHLPTNRNSLVIKRTHI